MNLTRNVIWGDLVRREFDDHIQWMPRWVLEENGVDYWRYSVHRYPFVPDYHLVHYPNDNPGYNEDCIVLSTHKTLAEAVSILKVLLANGGVVYFDD
jgi:hypothetical protein